jgi:hypothetical protein
MSRRDAENSEIEDQRLQQSNICDKRMRPDVDVDVDYWSLEVEGRRKSGFSPYRYYWFTGQRKQPFSTQGRINDPFAEIGPQLQLPSSQDGAELAVPFIPCAYTPDLLL